MNDETLAALKKALPYLIRLGDFIGNGEGETPMGRCEAVLAVRNAIENIEKCGYYCAEDVGHVDHA